MPFLAVLGIALICTNVGIIAGHWIAQHHHHGT